MTAVCLQVPGRIVALLGTAPMLASVEVSGTLRTVNLAMLEDEGPSVGDWVVIHSGLALAKIDEAEARRALASLALLGRDDEELGAHATDLEG